MIFISLSWYLQDSESLHCHYLSLNMYIMAILIRTNTHTRLAAPSRVVFPFHKPNQTKFFTYLCNSFSYSSCRKCLPPKPITPRNLVLLQNQISKEVTPSALLLQLERCIIPIYIYIFTFTYHYFLGDNERVQGREVYKWSIR